MYHSRYGLRIAGGFVNVGGSNSWCKHSQYFFDMPMIRDGTLMTADEDGVVKIWAHTQRNA